MIVTLHNYFTLYTQQVNSSIASLLSSTRVELIHSRYAHFSFNHAHKQLRRHAHHLDVIHDSWATHWDFLVQALHGKLADQHRSYLDTRRTVYNSSRHVTLRTSRHVVYNSRHRIVNSVTPLAHSFIQYTREHTFRSLHQQ